MGHTTKILTGVLAALTFALGGLTLSMSAGGVEANADPPKTASRIILNTPTQDETSATVQGKITADDGTPIPGAPVTLSIDSGYTDAGATSTDGSFSFTFPNPSVGDHTVKISWPGDATFAEAQASVKITIKPKAKTPCTLAITVDPAEANPGMTIGVTGTLVSSTGAPISAALITFGLSWGTTGGFVVTDDSGGFDTALALPQDSQFPSSITVTASFGGDSVYEATSIDSPITVVAAPAGPEDPEVSSSAAASTKPTTEPTHTSTPTPTAVPIPSLRENPHLMTALVISAAVSITAIVILIVVGIVSNIKHRLASDERRGFGSDFGKIEH